MSRFWIVLLITAVCLATLGMDTDVLAQTRIPPP